MFWFLGFLIALAALLESWSLRHSLDGVDAEQLPSCSLTEPGEPFLLRTRITNRSRRLIPFVRVIDVPPTSLSGSPVTPFEEASAFLQDARKERETSTYLMPRQIWQREEQISLPARGRYIFRGLSLSGGDFLGLRETGETFAQLEEVVVMPAPSDDTEAISSLGGFFGDDSVRRFLFEDPVLTLGVREYTGREPQKMIAWQRSAQTGQLMVKNYDYTVEKSLDILLNADCGQTSGPEKDMEALFSLTRSVLEWTEEHRIRTRVVTNVSSAGAGGLWQRIGDGYGPEHFLRIMEGLGRATYFKSEPLPALLSRAEKQTVPGRRILILSAADSPALREGASRLAALSGGPVPVLVTAKPGERGSV